MNIRRHQRLAVGLVAACLLAMGPVGTAHAVATDAWDVTTGGTTITASSGFLGGGLVCGTAMFGASACVETTNMLFSDSFGAGFVHVVEWQTTGSVTIESFNLVAVHDGHTDGGPAPNACSRFPAPNASHRDAQHRGFDRFTLYACGVDCTVPNRTLLFDLSPVPLGDDNGTHAGENANLYDPTGAISARKNVLNITENVLASVSTDRWRAEFVQFGCGPTAESGPRIVELDGFLTAVFQLSKELTSGPDLDTDGEVDIAIQILQTTTTGYDFELTYIPDESDPDNVVIIDTVPAEWDVSMIDGNPVADTNDAPHKGPNQGDGVGPGCGQSESGLGTDGNVEIERGGTVGKKCSSDTDILWTLTPSLGLQTLLVDVTTRQSPSGKVKFKPTSCGKLTINDGAQAFEADGQGNLVLRLGGVPGGAIDPNGEPVPIGDPSNSLMLVAVDDLNGGGLVGDGSGDEDGDGLTDADEAFNVGTNPCDPDTDGDGVLDGADQCPLRGKEETGFVDVDGCPITP